MSLTRITYGSRELTDVKFSFKRNLLGMLKGVNIEFSPNHIFLLNIEENRKTCIGKNRRYLESFDNIPHTKNSIFVKKGEYFSFAKRDTPEYETDSGIRHFYTCAVSLDGRSVITTEPMIIKDEEKKKDYYYRRIVSQNISGRCEVIICDWNKAVDKFKWMLNVLNKSAKEYTDFDRFMRKYFSFYKYSFTLKYTPIVNGYGFFDKFMYKYFSFYK